ncbi:unnamed protein product, partial [Rotaria sp. Silwood1]
EIYNCIIYEGGLGATTIFISVNGRTFIIVIVIGRVSIMVIDNGLVIIIIINDIYHDGGTVLMLVVLQ